MATKKTVKKVAKKAATKTAKKAVKKTVKKAAKKTATKKVTKKASKKVAKKAAKRAKTTTSKSLVSDDSIRHEAYCVFQERCRDSVSGDSESDWLEAKRRLSS